MTSFQKGKPRIHFLQHASFEGPAYFVTWASARNYPFSVTRLDTGESLPAAESVDVLVIMGGPMSVNEEKSYPWLITEKQFIRDVIKAGKKVVGVCLGAQMIASALGARVRKCHNKEIGWFPVYPAGEIESGLFREFPDDGVTVFHWHGETFEIPEGGRLIIGSKACPNQAFMISDQVIGMQFHLEATPDSTGQLLEACRDELDGSEYVQTEEEIVSGMAHCGSANRLLSSLMDSIIHPEDNSGRSGK